MVGCGEFWCDWVKHIPFWLMNLQGTEVDGDTWA